MASENTLTHNPCKKNSKAWHFLEICDLDFTTGYSAIITHDVLEKYGLKTTNGGDWCRSDGPLGKYFNIHRIKKKGRIDSIQLCGYKKNTFSNTIKKEIKEYYKSMECRVLGIGGHFIQIDHKDGRKDDFDMPLDQTLDDFQPLHQNANIAKRQHCKLCKETNVRFDAKKLGYSVSQWIGSELYTGSCIGCFWYDPYVFNAEISKQYVKIR